MKEKSVSARDLLVPTGLTETVKKLYVNYSVGLVYR